MENAYASLTLNALVQSSRSIRNAIVACFPRKNDAKLGIIFINHQPLISCYEENNNSSNIILLIMLTIDFYSMVLG